jgi:hypothetical protein
MILVETEFSLRQIASIGFCGISCRRAMVRS